MCFRCMDRVPKEMNKSNITVNDFHWKNGFLVCQRGETHIKISSTKAIIKIKPSLESGNCENYHYQIGQFINKINDECFLSHSEIFINHSISHQIAKISIEHADFGHSNFDLLLQAFNSKALHAPEVINFNCYRYHFLPPRFQYLNDICEQYSYAFPFHENGLVRIENIALNRRQRRSSWPIAVKLQDILDFIEKYVRFPRYPELVISKEMEEEAVNITYHRHAGNEKLKLFQRTIIEQLSSQDFEDIIIQRIREDRDKTANELERLRTKQTQLQEILLSLDYNINYNSSIDSSSQMKAYEVQNQKLVRFQDQAEINTSRLGLGKMGYSPYENKRPPLNDETSKEASPSLNKNDVQTNSVDIFNNDWRASDLQYKGTEEEQNETNSEE